MRTKIFFSFFICALVVASATTKSFSQSQTTVAQSIAQPLYSYRQNHDPDGIGKFYQGREIAFTCGDHDWLERPTREVEEKVDLLVDALQLKSGEAVADIGAGTGYITRKLAKKIGEKGTVYAEEIQQEMLVVLTNKLAQVGIHNVKPILGTLTDCKLRENSVDTILMVDVYHEFDHPFEMMQSICHALKPGGRVVFVEYRGEDPNVPIKLAHKMSVAQVRKEAALLSLVFVEANETLPRQHILIFKKGAPLHRKSK